MSPMSDPWNNWFFIHSTIADHDSHRVGVKLSSQPTAHLIIDGDTSNTFTGNMEVYGSHLLSLNKRNGAVAIQRGLILSNRAQLHIGYKDQFGRQAIVKLHNASFNLWNLGGGFIREIFHQLAVTGESELNFHAGGYYAKAAIYLDDLFIHDWARLLIKKWEYNGDYLLLVRKDSEHLSDSLSRIKFDGRYGSAGVRSHNWEYWEIGVGAGFSKLPEPSTYGAIFGGVGVVLALGRNRRCVWQRSAHSPQKRKG